MPRPRFSKLSPAKRQRILEAAAKEFAAHGYQGASLNKILEEAQISKGAAYYYFDDKADLYTTTVKQYTQELIGDLTFDVERLDGETFWPRLADFYWQQFVASYDQPWAFAAIKSAARLSEGALAENAALAAYLEVVLENVLVLLQHGQEVGAVRRDLPDDLLLSLFIAVDDAGDRWLLDRWEELTREELEAVVRKIADAMRRLLTPAAAEEVPMEASVEASVEGSVESYAEANDRGIGKR